MKKDISAIVVSYHTGDVLFDCIESLSKMEGIGEILLINNGNPENVLEKLKELDSENKIKLVDGAGNIGFSKACNLGAKLSKLDYLMFTNPDCYSDDKLFAIKLRGAIEKNPQYYFATSLILNNDGSVQKTCRRNLMNFSNALSESFSLANFGFSKINRDILEIENLPEISEVPAFSGALFFAKKDVYFSVGGLSEEYFLHVEDMDLCMKIFKSGGKIAFVKNAVIKHSLSTSDVSSKFLEFHKARGFVIYLNKFFPWTNTPILKQIISAGIWLRYYLKTWK